MSQCPHLHRTFNNQNIPHGICDDCGEALFADVSVSLDEIGIKHDQGKPQYHLIEPIALEALAQVLTFGMQKYSEENWKKVDKFYKRYYNALERHLQAWRKGERLDPETGMPHLWHAMTNLHFLVWKDDNDEYVKTL